MFIYILRLVRGIGQIFLDDVRLPSFARLARMMGMRWLLTSALALLVVGCSERPTPTLASPATAPAPAAAVKPFVLHLPGVSGTSIVDYTLRDGLRKGGFDGPFVIFDWTCHDPGIPALHNRARNEEQAAIAAELLVKQYRAHP